jgi:hypothetical protein
MTLTLESKKAEHIVFRLFIAAERKAISSQRSAFSRETLCLEPGTGKWRLAFSD